MGAPGREAAFDQRRLGRKRALDPITGHRRLSAPFADHRHLFAVGRAAADVAGDLAGAGRTARPRRWRHRRGRCGARRNRATARGAPISVLATTISPLVSLSRRWTMPGRRTPPIPDKAGAAMRDQRVDQRAVGIARGRVNDQPGGLVDDDQMCILEADIERDRLGSPAPHPQLSGKITTKLCPARTRSEGSRSGMSRCSYMAGHDQLFEPGAREFRQAKRQHPVEALSGIGLTRLDLDYPRLGAFRAQLASAVRPAPYVDPTSRRSQADGGAASTGHGHGHR